MSHATDPAIIHRAKKQHRRRRLALRIIRYRTTTSADVFLDLEEARAIVEAPLSYEARP